VFLNWYCSRRDLFDLTFGAVKGWEKENPEACLLKRKMTIVGFDWFLEKVSLPPNDAHVVTGPHY